MTMENHKHCIRALIVALAMIVLAAGAHGQSLPRLQLETLDGETVRIYDYLEDGPIMINFWSLSCAPCRREMKHLDEFARTYADSGFQVISINIDTPKSMSRVRARVRSNAYAFPVFSDPRNQIFRKLGGRRMPYSIFVTADGSIDSRHIGYSPGDEKSYRRTIESMLNEPE